MRLLAIFLACLGLAVPAAHLLAAGNGSARVQVVDERGLPIRDAVVEITPAGGARSPSGFPWRAAMAQKNLQFTPGTLIVAKGSTVAFPNLDRVRHSIYSFSKIARFEIDLYGRDQTRAQRFDVAGSAALGCNIHDNMRGYVRVVDTPYAAKTNGNGIANISAVPGGSATVTIWHPRLRAPGNEVRYTVSLDGGLSRKYKVKLR
ncbi:cupredoxin domain-containing protein [Parerythrobacter aestuarii]|uniref:methylamine utilization protein n=1 Tax=Parerythrobacter aestuarii TaxID=3020909 RepID=UPI0024DE9BD4|nr:methylamine utilization protein [Parerythrobacter aestuarii]